MWWETIRPGTRLELGLVHVDRKGSTEDWLLGLDEQAVLQARREYQQIVEDVAGKFDAIQPLNFQGDGAMLFVQGEPITSHRVGPGAQAAARAGELAIALHAVLQQSRFVARIAAHCGEVVFNPSTGAMASPDVDRTGHLDADCPPRAVAMSEDVYLCLPDHIRKMCDYLGTTRRDGTVAWVYPQAFAAKRGPGLIPASEDREPNRSQLIRLIDAADIRRVRYVGLRLSRREPPSLDLLDVFIPLDAEPRLPRKSPVEEMGGKTTRTRRGSGAGEVLRYPPWARPDSRGAPPRSFAEVLRTHRHVVVLGEPGSGKSTLLRWLAVAAAGGRVTCRDRLGLDERLLPLLVPVGRLDEIRKAMRAQTPLQPPDLLNVLTEYLHERNAGVERSALLALLRGELERGRCLVLLDGLDEVPTIRRPEIAGWIESFASAFRDNRIIATSRVFGFAGPELTPGAVVVLRPFGHEQIERYLLAWHRAYRIWLDELTLQEAEEDAPKSDEEANALLGVLDRDERLRGLASNPFLLATMALVHRAEGKLPSHRIQLYDIFARALYETWDTARRIARGTPASAPAFDFEVATPILGRVAYWLHEQYSSGAAPEQQVEDEITRALRDDLSVSEAEAKASAKQFLRLVGEQLQIIAERGPKLFGFLHLTFEEFFAAAYLHAKEQFADEAARRWTDSRWEEVILLGVGILAILQGRQSAAEALIRTMLGWRVHGFPYVTTLLGKQAILAAKASTDAPTIAREVHGAVAEAFLAKLLRDPYPVLREQARRALPRMLGTVFGRLVCERLIVRLAAADAETASRAAEALGALGSREAFDPLLAALHEDRPVGLRRAVAEALGRLRDPRAVGPLVVVLRDAHDRILRNVAANALEALASAEAVEPLLGVLDQAGDPDTRELVAYVLARLKGPLAFDRLFRMLSGASTPRDRAMLIGALGELGDRRAADAFLEALDGEDQEIRIAAIVALPKLKDARAPDRLLAVLRNAPPQQLARAAAEAAVLAGGSTVLEPLLALLGDGFPPVRAAVAYALGLLGNGAAVEPLCAVLQENRATVRVAAAQALGVLGDERGANALLRALDDDDVEVCAAAAAALGALGHRPAVRPLRAALRARPSTVARAGAKALGLLGDRESLAALVAALDHSDPGVRAEAAHALGLLGDRRAVRPLQRCVKDPDPGVVDAAVRALWLISERLVGGRRPGKRPSGARRRH